MKIGMLCVCGVLLSHSFAAYAYEIETHGRLTEQSVNQSTLINRLADFDLDPADPEPFGTIYYDVRSADVKERTAYEFERERIAIRDDYLSIKGWLMRGAIREDDLSENGCRVGAFLEGRSSECNPQDAGFGNFNRVLHHFYDPTQDRGLSGTFIGYKAPSWALGAVDAFASNPQLDADRPNHYTIADAREAMYRALTGRDSEGNELMPAAANTSGAAVQATTPEDIRKAYWATTFRALGDVLHLLQDMAQPQHTRNETHPGSVYERYINARAVGGSTVNSLGATQILSPLNYAGYGPVGFDNYAEFFSTRKKDGILAPRGLADYSNRGFFTAAKNMGNTWSNTYTLPDRNPDRYSRDTIYHNAGGWTFPIDILRGDVPDSLNPGSSATGVMLSSESVWDQFLENAGERRAYSLNLYNYDAMADLLIPRAVGYSAGMLNYFFRGKLDFVTAPNSGQNTYQIVNLGPESISGKFALYYDAKDGKRYPVEATGAHRHPDDPKAWQLEIPADPLGEHNKSPPISFTPPNSDDPELRPELEGEYMLVFNGDMGEEKVGDGVVGAVAAKQVGAYTGALYIAGEDASGNRVTFKTDRQGTRILNGRDQYGELFTTPTTCCEDGQTDFDPTPRSYISKVPHVKQVSFGTGNDYRVIALSIADGENYLWNAKLNRLESAPTISWAAHSDDSTIGDFIFRFHSISWDGSTATIVYIRTYIDGDNKTQIQEGVLDLPTLPSLSYRSFLTKDKLFVSPDGLTLSGFESSVQEDGEEYLDSFEIRIMLSTTPSVQRFRERRAPNEQENRRTNQPYTLSGHETQDEGHAIGIGINTVYGRFIRKELRTSVGYINKEMVRWETQYESISDNDSRRNYTHDYKATVLWASWLHACDVGHPPPRVTEGQIVDTGYHKDQDITEIRSTSQSGLLFWKSKRAKAASNRTHKEIETWRKTNFCPNGILSVYTVRDGSKSEEETPGEIFDPKVIEGFKLLVPLTDKAKDAVVTRNLDDTDTPEFRSHSLKNKRYIADASPIGEVFFATTDRSVEIHEPKSGGMKKVVIPPHVIKLLSVLWL